MFPYTHAWVPFLLAAGMLVASSPETRASEESWTKLPDGVLGQVADFEGADGVIVDKSKVYNTAADWIRAMKLGQPDEYLVDPTSEESQKAQQGIAPGQSLGLFGRKLLVELEQEISLELLPTSPLGSDGLHQIHLGHLRQFGQELGHLRSQSRIG